MSDHVRHEKPENHAGTNANPMRQQVYTAAKAYVQSGLSLIPIRTDGTKMPAFELLPKVWCEESGKYKRPWGGFRERRPTLDEVRDWYRDSGDDYGMAILGGAVSGGLEIIDIDNLDFAGPWSRQVEQFAPGLLARLVRVQTPRPGLHIYYRCDVFGGNQKLARIADPETLKRKPKTVIELKGEGGYCLAPPSPAGCHKSGRCYTFLDGRDLTMVPTITADERRILIGCAKMADSWQPPKRKVPPKSTHSLGGRPGDDFNHRADWGEILEPHGWVWMGSGGDGSDLWCRPGKSAGTSATTNYGGSDLLFVFSSNADPLEEGTAYTKFSAYALLSHGGDFHAAASALAAKGYGSGQARSSKVVKPFSRYAKYPVRSPQALP